MIKCEFVINDPTDYRVIFCDTYYINYKAEWINMYLKSRILNMNFRDFETLRIYKDERLIIEIKGVK